MRRAFTQTTVMCGLCLVLVLTLSTGIPSAAIAADTVKIGLLDPLSGTFESLGRTWLTAVQFAVDEQNAKGGLLGKKIEILAEDDEGKPDVATRKAKKLILENKVNFITSGFGSHIATALNQVATTSKTIYINYAAMTDAIQGKEFSPYSFRVCMNQYSVFSALAVSMAKKPFRKYYSICPDYVAGYGMAKLFEEQLKIHEPDAKIVATDFSPLGTKDFAPYITKVIAAKPDALLAGVFSTDLINLVKQARSLGLKAPFPILAPLGIHPYIINELKDDAVGMYFTHQYSLRVKTPQNEELIRRYHEQHKNDKDFLTWWPFPDAALAILGWEMTFAAVEKAGSLDPEKLIQAYEGFQWKSPVGLYTMRKCDHQLISPMYGGQIKAGPNPFYDFPWTGENIEEFPADKVSLPATPDYNPRCK
jgi:branched-chain amino acid transport system substrate-binding protein